MQRGIAGPRSVLNPGETLEDGPTIAIRHAPPSLRAAVARFAAEDDRSIASAARILLLEAVRARRERGSAAGTQ
jgi:hypothetical protein